jgi:hypothetical protein
MPTPSNWPGWDIVSHNEPFFSTDYYRSAGNSHIFPLVENITMLGPAGHGPTLPGQTFAQRHGRTQGLEVLRKNSDWKPLPRRIIGPGAESKPLPLP